MANSGAFPSTPLSTLPGPAAPIHALAYSATPGTYILTGGADKTIRLYNPFPARSGPSTAVQPGKLIQSFSGHGYEVLDIAVSSDNARFSSVGGDRSVLLWDVASAKVLKRFGGTAGHSARINCVAFAGVEDSLIISGSFDASARIWDTRSNSYKPVQILTEAKDSVSCLLAGSSCGVGREAEIITGSTDGRVRCYDVRMGRVTTDVLGEPVTSLCATHDGEALLVGTLYGKNRLIDRRNGGCLQTYTSTPSEYRIKSCLGGKGDRWVLSGTENGEVVAWDMMSGNEVKRVQVPKAEGDGKVKLDAFGRPKERKNVVGVVAWRRDGGRSGHWAAAGTDGAVTVFGPGAGIGD